MPRTVRQAPDRMVCYVLNRGVGRMQFFDKPGDYGAFERVLAEILELRPMSIRAHPRYPWFKSSLLCFDHG